MQATTGAASVYALYCVTGRYTIRRLVYNMYEKMMISSLNKNKIVWFSFATGGVAHGLRTDILLLLPVQQQK